MRPRPPLPPCAPPSSPWPLPRNTCLCPPPRSTDPTDTPSRIRRGSSNHSSPHLTPPLAGRQAIAAAARERRRQPSPAASPPGPTSYTSLGQPRDHPTRVPRPNPPPELARIAPPAPTATPRTTLRDLRSFRGPACKITSQIVKSLC
jgi:hypothetical protein